MLNCISEFSHLVSDIKKLAKWNYSVPFLNPRHVL